MHKKFQINRTKIEGGCQSDRKVVTNNSKSDFPVENMHKKFEVNRTNIKSCTKAEHQDSWNDLTLVHYSVKVFWKKFLNIVFIFWPTVRRIASTRRGAASGLIAISHDLSALWVVRKTKWLMIADRRFAACRPMSNSHIGKYSMLSFFCKLIIF